MHECVSTTSIFTNDAMIYYLMTEDDVSKEIAKTVREISEVLDLKSKTIVRLLLNYFHWDKDILTDRYWEDPDKLFRILNLPNPNSTLPLDYNPLSPPSTIEHSPSSPSATQGYVTCKTCCIDRPSDEFYSLACNHQHCLQCWQFYLESTIKDQSNGQRISCPSRCNQIVDDKQISRLLSHNEPVKKRYERMLVNTFVDTNRSTHWCPGASCSTIVKLKSSAADCARMISCEVCHTIFCFQCLKEWHDPIQCSLLQKWEKKNHDESMTGEWLVASQLQSKKTIVRDVMLFFLTDTKECPSCHSSIEKNGGCNHMTCRKPGCAFEFCWLCSGSWKEHASRQCNVYSEDELSKNRASARETLARYMHHFVRYQTHNQSLELEKQLRSQVEERVSEMQAGAMSFTAQRAIYKAFDVLQQCRRTLKYTYAFAFYLYRNNQAEVFEQNQADLERATEALSGFLEQEIDIDQSIGVKLMDKTHYCEQRRKILLNHCKEGYGEHYWANLDPY